MLVLRDFEEDNNFDKIIQEQGFFKINMPESCVVENKNWTTYEEYAKDLSPRSQKHFSKEVLPFERHYAVVIKDKLDKTEMERAYELYNNVQK